jgi:hypothetical protein
LNETIRPARGTIGQALALCLVFLLSLTTAEAQSPEAPAPQVTTEEIEPRVVGRPGMTTIGFSGFVDRAFSTASLMPLNYTVQADGLRFVTGHIAVRLGAAGSGSIGGDDAATRPTGTGAPSLRAFAGGLYFLRPKSMVSPYAGAEYWAQLTQRAGRDGGSLVGKFGLQAAVSSRTSLFAEGGYGIGLTRGSDDELVTRIVGQIGFRVRFR